MTDGVRPGAMRWAAVAAVALPTLAVVWLAKLPATWVDRGLAQVSAGRVRVAEAEGTVWAGTGRLVLADPLGGQTAGGRGGARLDGLTLPGRVHWQVEGARLLHGALTLRVSHEQMRTPVKVEATLSRVSVSAGVLDLPRLGLDRLGSPWNTIRPAAAVTVAWDDAEFRRGRLQTRASIELIDVTAALTPVKPLGSYRIEIMGTTDQTQISLSTLAGPLRLTGQGSWQGSAGLRFRAQAWAEGVHQSRLQALLGLMGRREGDRTLIALGG